jgi:ABC-type nitrate/sulfonate/bicarbonate transport system permease component
VAEVAIRTRPGAADLLYPGVALLGFLLVWWVVATLLGIPRFLLPHPGAVGGRLVGSPGLFLTHTVATLEKVLLGGAAGVAAGFTLAVVLANLPLLRRGVYPYLVTVRVLPKVAVAPLLLIYLGTGTLTAVVFVALISFFPMVLSTAAGLDRTPVPHRDLLRTVNAPGLARFLRVELPYAVPDVFAGLKQSVTLAIIGAVVAEWVVADSGLGNLILLGSENLQTDLMLAALAVLVGVGLLLYGLIALLQRRVSWDRADGRPGP